MNSDASSAPRGTTPQPVDAKLGDDEVVRKLEEIRAKIVLSYESYAELGLAVLAAVEDPARCDCVTAAHLRRLRAAWERVEKEID